MNLTIRAFKMLFRTKSFPDKTTGLCIGARERDLWCTKRSSVSRRKALRHGLCQYPFVGKKKWTGTVVRTTRGRSCSNKLANFTESTCMGVCNKGRADPVHESQFTFMERKIWIFLLGVLYLNLHVDGLNDIGRVSFVHPN